MKDKIIKLIKEYLVQYNINLKKFNHKDGTSTIILSPFKKKTHNSKKETNDREEYIMIIVDFFIRNSILNEEDIRELKK